MSGKTRTWDVLLVGGASGTGKTSVSYRLAQHFGIGITEIDDFQVLLETMTTPEQQPVLHYWNTKPEDVQLTPEQVAEHGVKVCEVMVLGLEAVIANHLESNAPVVLEGDFLLPALAAQSSFLSEPNAGRVRTIFLYEGDEAQITANYLAREPEVGDQSFRARVSWLYGEWLKAEAERLGLAVVAARPWESVFERVLMAVT